MSEILRRIGERGWQRICQRLGKKVEAKGGPKDRSEGKKRVG